MVHPGDRKTDVLTTMTGKMTNDDGDGSLPSCECMAGAIVFRARAYMLIPLLAHNPTDHRTIVGRKGESAEQRLLSPSAHRKTL